MKRARLGLMAAVPLLLLTQGEDVRLVTRLDLDGAGMRVAYATGSSDRLEDVRTRLREASPGFDDEKLQAEGGHFTLTRTWRGNSMMAMPDAKLDIKDVVQEPLSIYSTYTWNETVKIYRDTATEAEKLGAQAAKLTYVLEMPGTVDQATVSPQATVTGGRIEWTLTGDQEQYTLTATSKRLRWDVLLVCLYVIGVLVGGALQFTTRRARNKPKRI
jgi:hypothetical protein